MMHDFLLFRRGRLHGISSSLRVRRSARRKRVRGVALGLGAFAGVASLSRLRLRLRARRLRRLARLARLCRVPGLCLRAETRLSSLEREGFNLRACRGHDGGGGVLGAPERVNGVARARLRLRSGARRLLQLLGGLVQELAAQEIERAVVQTRSRERLRALERPDSRAERGSLALRLASRRLGSVEARARLVQRALGGAQRQAEL